MLAEFHNGPYDGLKLDHNDVNLYTGLLPRGHRKFLVLPPTDEWEAVRQGELSKDGPFEGHCAVYELVRVAEARVACFYDKDGSALAEAERQLESMPIEPVKIPQGYKTFCCWLGEFLGVTLPAPFIVITDEKDRTWACCQRESVSETTERQLYAVAGDRMSDKRLFVETLCRNRKELIASLSDTLN